MTHDSVTFDVLLTEHCVAFVAVPLNASQRKAVRGRRGEREKESGRETETETERERHRPFLNPEFAFYVLVYLEVRTCKSILEVRTCENASPYLGLEQQWTR